MSNLAWSRGMWVRLAERNFKLIGYAAPPISKIAIFLAKIHPAVAFMCPTYYAALGISVLH